MMRNAIRQIPVGFRLFLNRCSIVPFETAVGVLSIWAGGVALLNATFVARTFNSSLPQVYTAAFNLVYLIAGAFIVTGLGWAYRNLETSGLIFLVTTLIVRVVSLVFIVGWMPETISAIVQGIVFGVAGGVRIRSLMKNYTLVFAKDIPDIVARQAHAEGLTP